MKQWEQAAITLASTGMSQRKIAKKLGIPRSTLGDFFRKKNDVAEPIVYDSKAKILILDIETAPFIAAAFGRWKQNIGQAAVLSEGYLLCYAAKWYGSNEIISSFITEKEDDRDIVLELFELIDQADIVVAHNACKFDIPTIFTRMVYHGITPPSQTKIVDTLKIAKSTFRFPSNALDSIASYLGLDRKLSNSGMDLWIRAMSLEEEAVAEMTEYNIQDIIVLEQVYGKLRAWDSKAPSINVYYNDCVKRCVCCGSDHLIKSSKAYTQQSEFDAYTCVDCGKISRTKKNLRSKESMQNTLMNVI